MVRKGSKRGLNTGNTIRQYHRDPSIQQYQRYGFLIINSEIGVKDLKASQVMGEVLAALPKSDGTLELSLNKHRRWELPSYMKHKVEVESDSKDVQITVLEHSMYGPGYCINGRNTCTSYFSNVGDVRACVSNTEMNTESAKQGNRDQDHLSRLERRAFKKAKMTSPIDRPTSDGHELPLYECHIAYGAKNDGKFYKELATKGFAQSGKKNRNHTTGWSKIFQHDDLRVENYDLHDDEEDSYEEEEIAPDSDTYSTATMPLTVPLSDLVNDSLKRKHRTLRRIRTSSFEML